MNQDNPFELGYALIKDEPHVKVERLPPETGFPSCRYRKYFKDAGIRYARYWELREKAFLVVFDRERLKHAVRFTAIQQAPDPSKPLGTITDPIMVETLDAGLTVENWLHVKPHYANSAHALHPFQPVSMFLALLRGCLVALREIHALGILHLDIKEDNICLPYSPYPGSPNQPITINPEGIRLIDFSFSVILEDKKLRLENPLPILPVGDYQSNLLKEALSEDSKKSQGPFKVEQLHIGCDLFSLAYMAEQIFKRGLLNTAGADGEKAIQFAGELVVRLKACDKATAPRPKPWWNPKNTIHDQLITEIDGWLRKMLGWEHQLQFTLEEEMANEEQPVCVPNVAETPLISDLEPTGWCAFSMAKVLVVFSVLLIWTFLWRTFVAIPAIALKYAFLVFIIFASWLAVWPAIDVSNLPVLSSFDWNIKLLGVLALFSFSLDISIIRCSFESAGQFLQSSWHIHEKLWPSQYLRRLLEQELKKEDGYGKIPDNGILKYIAKKLNNKAHLKLAIIISNNKSYDLFPDDLQHCVVGTTDLNKIRFSPAFLGNRRWLTIQEFTENGAIVKTGPNSWRLNNQPVEHPPYISFYFLWPWNGVLELAENIEDYNNSTRSKTLKMILKRPDYTYR